MAAILAADVVGYSRLMGADEVGTLKALMAHRGETVDPAFAEHGGRIVKTTGDGMLVEFASVVDAVTCAVAMQSRMNERKKAAEPKITFRVGINIGDIIIEGDDIFGDGVNIAARVESECEPGGVYLSGSAFDQVRGKTDFTFDELGEKLLKNIDRPVRLYAVSHPGLAPGKALNKVATLPLPDKPSIAVLPFQNMSGDPEQEYFADGVVDDMITALSRFKSLFVIARNSSFTYKGKAVDIKQVGRELGVRYVLEGSVRRSISRVRITGQLIEASTGAHIWADRFEGGLVDIFDLQDQITESVVGAIAPAMEKAEIERAKHKSTDNLDAHDLYLRGLARYYQCIILPNRRASEEALRLFASATDIDPDFAAAYGCAASCYTIAKASGWTLGNEEIVEVKRLSQAAIACGQDDALALAFSAMALAYVGCDLRSSSSLIDRALAINSNLAAAWHYGGWIKNWLGDPEAGLERFERAMRLSPLDQQIAPMKAGAAHCLFYQGRYDEAASLAALVLQDAPNAQPPLRIKAASSAMAGQTEEAREAVNLLEQLYPTLRVSNLKEVLGPYRREDVALYEEAMRRAGLPE
ncbi:adenylate/guanylate cyclase domain-containing protein [Bradyrhizobium sp.]|uniref:adenylate/guanylate cyclase domain-containing protein n=1 Tax=Bradyrhizobium sp. TaxID=376 RepID=UPI0026391D00|nr:adenylate/guanylate cyclase domain-containing protein [Bradyrhizobium sp.]